MNKYMGFYELKDINLPTVPWKVFSEDSVLEEGLLWSVRVAVVNSADLNLPRAIGVAAEEAVKKGCEFLHTYREKGIVIYYPYFIAEKSGVLEVNSTRTVIEAVDKDLWNLVTCGCKNITAIFPNGTESGVEVQYHGDESFLSNMETNELLGCASVLRGRFRSELSEGGSIFAEWSYAYSTDVRKEPIGERYLVFYELRGL